MNVWQRFKLVGRMIWEDWFLMKKETPYSPARPTPTPPPSQSQQAQSAQAGHIKVKQHIFRRMTANEVFTELDERHLRNGGVMKGHSTNTYVETASGKIIKPDQAKIFCRVCGLAEDELLRSAVSHIALCFACSEEFTKPNGEKVRVAPWELQTLADEYNTWINHGVRPKEYQDEA